MSNLDKPTKATRDRGYAEKVVEIYEKLCRDKLKDKSILSKEDIDFMDEIVKSKKSDRYGFEKYENLTEDKVNKIFEPKKEHDNHSITSKINEYLVNNNLCGLDGTETPERKQQKEFNCMGDIKPRGINDICPKTAPTKSTAPATESTSTAPTAESTSTAPTAESTSTAPATELTSTAPTESTSTAPAIESTSTAPTAGGRKRKTRRPTGKKRKSRKSRKSRKHRKQSRKH